MLHSTLATVSAPTTAEIFRGSITHPARPLCAPRGRRYRRLAQHSLPGRLLGSTWVRLSPTGRASFSWRLPTIIPPISPRSPELGPPISLPAASNSSSHRGAAPSPTLVRAFLQARPRRPRHIRVRLTGHRGSDRTKAGNFRRRSWREGPQPKGTANKSHFLGEGLEEHKPRRLT
jgi:hypothetical protein